MSAVAATVQTNRHLLRILGLGFGVAVVVGDMVGVGILRTTGPSAGRLGEPVLIYLVWGCIGVYVLMAVNTLAELATAIPKAGGPYVFVRRGFGDYFGFVCGWSDFGIQTISIAGLTIAGSEFLAQAMPPLAGHENLLAPGLIVLLAALNSLGLRTSSTVQQLMSLLKVLLLAVLVVAAFTYSGKSTSAGVTMASHGASIVAIIVSMQIVLEVYGGYNAGCYFMEETTEPGRTVPRSLLYGVLLVMAVYLAVNVALLHVLSPEEMGGSKLAAADALARVYGPAARTGVALLAFVSAIGIVNTGMLLAPRILYGMSRDGLFLGFGTFVTRQGVPLKALWLSAGIAAIFSLLSSFEILFAATAFLTAFLDLLCNGSLFVLRRREPNLPRPYRAFGYPWIPSCVLLTAAALLTAFLFGNPRPSLLAVGVLVMSYPLFTLMHRRRTMQRAQRAST
jgi:APA family basic amino acid/polyamine antiporter